MSPPPAWSSDWANGCRYPANGARTSAYQLQVEAGAWCAGSGPGLYQLSAFVDQTNTTAQPATQWTCFSVSNSSATSFDFISAFLAAPGANLTVSSPTVCVLERKNTWFENNGGGTGRRLRQLSPSPTPSPSPPSPSPPPSPLPAAEKCGFENRWQSTLEGIYLPIITGESQPLRPVWGQASSFY
jgi:hypothetical protein